MESFEFRREQGRLILYAVFFSVMIIVGQYHFWQEHTILIGRIIIPGGAVAIVGYLWYRVFVRKPMLIINELGISYKKKDLVLWEAISSYKIIEYTDGDGDLFEKLVFTFHNGRNLTVRIYQLESKSDVILKAVKQCADIPYMGREKPSFFVY